MERKLTPKVHTDNWWFHRRKTDLSSSLFFGSLKCKSEIGDKPTEFPFARFFVRLAQERRRVDGGNNFWGKIGFEQGAALLGDTKGRAKDGLGGSCAEANQQIRPNNTQLCFQPGPTCSNFSG